MCLINWVSKASPESAAWFLNASSKVWEKNHKLREGLLNKKKPGFDGFENSEPLHIANNVKIKQRLLSEDKIQGNARKMWFKDEVKGMIVKHFFKASENQSWCLRALFSQEKNKRPFKILKKIKGMSHRSSQQQNL